MKSRRLTTKERGGGWTTAVLNSISTSTVYKNTLLVDFETGKRHFTLELSMQDKVLFDWCMKGVGQFVEDFGKALEGVPDPPHAEGKYDLGENEA